ncbi:uncharacterized protein LOC114342831 [Diabrotica virgifera virgifera]|uniref:Uncharacterized protein LOC114342831 n=1 Tax=Diabrotica virgifera virgifera TaxID=50390 RepID=A0A6P7GHV1_DIAVI|nr:uncharacterized protein LOC114342831 [Diabrotica virgifera virgifera]
MNALTTFIAICCLSVTAKARPGIGSTKLEGIPDLQTFGGISYPKYDILHLGEYSKGFVPGDTIHESKHETITVPKPYPVKIPVPHPYPVHISKPYPVVETKYVKVPYAVPHEIVKHVPVPVEVPKPYPVSVHEHGDSHGAGSSPVYGVQNGGEHYGTSEQVSNYETQEPNIEEGGLSGHQENSLTDGNPGWVPVEHHEE